MRVVDRCLSARPVPLTLPVCPGGSNVPKSCSCTDQSSDRRRYPPAFDNAQKPDPTHPIPRPSPQCDGPAPVNRADYWRQHSGHAELCLADRSAKTGRQPVPPWPAQRQNGAYTRGNNGPPVDPLPDSMLGAAFPSTRLYWDNDGASLRRIASHHPADRAAHTVH